LPRRAKTRSPFASVGLDFLAIIFPAASKACQRCGRNERDRAAGVAGEQYGFRRLHPIVAIGQIEEGGFGASNRLTAWMSFRLAEMRGHGEQGNRAAQLGAEFGGGTLAWQALQDVR